MADTYCANCKQLLIDGETQDYTECNCSDDEEN